MEKEKRIYKFRGFCKDTQQWCFGSLVDNQNTKSTIIDATGRSLNCHPVSIGQFTGMCTDENIEVYEGDIINFPDAVFDGVVCFKDGGYIVKSLLSDNIYDLYWVFRRKMIGQPTPKIVGNIFERDMTHNEGL